MTRQATPRIDKADGEHRPDFCSTGNVATVYAWAFVGKSSRLAIGLSGDPSVAIGPVPRLFPMAFLLSFVVVGLIRQGRTVRGNVFDYIERFLGQRRP